MQKDEERKEASKSKANMNQGGRGHFKELKIWTVIYI